MLLRIVEDDPERGRLVLRASRWNLLDVLRRLVITVLAVASAGAGVVFLVYAGDLGFDWFVRLLVASLPFTIAHFFAGLADEQLAEIVIDGSAKLVRVRRRGRQIWRSTVLETRLDDPEVGFCLRAGIYPFHNYRRPELGLQLWDGRINVRPMRLLAKGFAIEGVDRRDEARALAEDLARRLGLGLRIDQDDLVCFEAIFAAPLPPPPPPAVEPQGYRRAPQLPKLALDAPPCFEPPPNPPALDLDSVRAVLGLQISRDDAGALVVVPRERAPVELSTFTKTLVSVGLGGALLSWLIDTDPWSMFFAVPAWVALWIGFCAVFIPLVPRLFGFLVVVILSMLVGLSNTRPLGFNSVELDGWRLDPGLLSGPRKRHRWRRGEVTSVVILDSWRTEQRRGSYPKHYRKHQLYLFAGVWVRLAGTAEYQEDPDKPTPLPPALLALAIEVARELDAPMHWSP